MIAALENFRESLRFRMGLRPKPRFLSDAKGSESDSLRKKILTLWVPVKVMKNVLFSICAAAIMTAIYRLIAPTDRFGAQIKLLVSCFVIVTVISAVSGEIPAWDISDILSADTSYNDYAVQLDNAVTEETARKLRDRISEVLAEEEIFPEKIYIDINISDKGRISINEIKLVFGIKEYEEKAERAVVLVQQEVGTRIKVTAEIASRAEKEQGVR